MSWNKNTCSLSEIDSLLRFLDKEKRVYTLSVLGKVKALGANDDDRSHYDMRRLEYSDTAGQVYVILEKIDRSSDCDSDDHIVSFEFKKELEPKNWKIEEHLEDSET
jgi:hypothetical protein